MGGGGGARRRRVNSPPIFGTAFRHQALCPENRMESSAQVESAQEMFMAAGHRGRPIADLVNHRLAVWTLEIDRVLLRMIKLAGAEELRSR
jgi:hypothetical protein